MPSLHPSEESPLSALDDMVNGLLSDVAKEKKKPKKKKTLNDKILGIRFAESTAPGLATIRNPWKDEALVQLMTVSTCKNCGNTGSSWEPYIFLEQVRTVRGKLERNISRIETCEYQDIYKSYKRRIEVRETSSCACPQCFKNYLDVDITQPVQINLPLKQENENADDNKES